MRILDGDRWTWADATESGDVEVRFAGRRRDDLPGGSGARSRGGSEAAGSGLAGRSPADRRPGRVAELAGIAPPGVGHAWVKQVHSAVVLRADRPGRAGEGDALVTGRSGLALSVVAADCVPVLVAAGGWIAAVHAGWRGIAAGVVGETVARLRAESAGTSSRWTAWIGPAIGGCCYQVGPEVAEAVAAASTPEAVLDWPSSDRPHLDLHRAVRAQLETAGVTDIRPLVACTRCDAARLHSYRRDRESAGRNLAAIWKR